MDLMAESVEKKNQEDRTPKRERKCGVEREEKENKKKMIRKNKRRRSAGGCMRAAAPITCSIYLMHFHSAIARSHHYSARTDVLCTYILFANDKEASAGKRVRGKTRKEGARK